MYVLKTRGTTEVPDYIQLRDDNFILVAHFGTKNYQKSIEKLDIFNKTRLIASIKSLAYGELKKIDE